MWYRLTCQASFLSPKVTPTLMPHWPKATFGRSYWMRDRYARRDKQLPCLQPLQLCSYSVTVHLKNSMVRESHYQEEKHECPRAGGVHVFPDHFREPMINL